MWNRRITESYYEEKRKEYRTEQKKINKKINQLHFADEEYYITSEYIVKLAVNASKLFENSEVKQKRLLINMTLQNLTLEDRTVSYDWINPYGKIAEYASRNAWLPEPDVLHRSITLIVQAFSDVVQMEALRVRWEEIKKLQLNATA